MKHSEYFDNLDLIEETWHFLLKEKFPENGKKQLLDLCKKGRVLFYKMILEDKEHGYTPPKTVPSFEREIMLLEKEAKNEEAIKLCEEAISLGVSSPWYQKKIERLKIK